MKNDKEIFPNGKGHISYSELVDWLECSYRHKLKHIDNIVLDSGSIHTALGTTVHDSMEHFFLTKKMPKPEEAIKQFRELISKLDTEAREAALVEVEEFERNLPDMISQVPEWLDKTFPGWQPVSAEHGLYEKIENQPGVKFKGFIDAVIKIPKKKNKKQVRLETLKGNKSQQEYIYYLLDWKTTGWGWKTEQKRKFEKQLQLILYKYFYCLCAGLPIKNTRCGFVLIKRIPKKTRSSCDRLELVPVSVGPKAIEKGLKTMHNMINQVKQGRTLKNRKHCNPFCVYQGTDFCR